MKLNKIKTTLLIAVLLLSTIVGLAVPAAMAATSVTADYVFEFNGVGEDAGWVVSPDADHGDYVAKLLWGIDADAESDYAYLRVYPELSTPITLDTLLTVGIPEFDYYLETYTATEMYLALELTFRAPDYTVSENLGWVDISVFPYTSSGYEWDEAAGDTWYTADGLDGGVFGVAYGEETDDTDIAIETASYPLSSIISDLIALDAVDGDWELTRVTPQIGWMAGARPETEVWIDNVVVGDETYELEPQNLIAGQTYAISWATNYASEDVNLIYTPEDQPDIDVTSATSASGVVNFYNVMPNSAGNWTLSDLADTLPTPLMDEDGLVKMSMTPAAGHEITAYFLVQPVEDLDIVVSPSSVDVESGTTVLSVTVTSDGEPVEDAYVNVEFWDDEAKHIDTDDTALLRGYTIQTLSSGVAMFDVEVPEVAGTIFVIAGTDMEPLLGDPDGDYFEHWGYKTIPVASEEFLDIDVSPESYLTAIPLDLTIELGNKDATMDILKASDQANALNITIVGSDMTGVITETGTYPIDSIWIYEASGTAPHWTQDDSSTYDFANAEKVVIRGHGDGTTYGITEQAVVTITDFKSGTVGDITITATSDIGGVASSTVKTIASPGAVDGGADYVDTGAKTISVTAPEALNIVEISVPDPLKVQFSAVPDGSAATTLTSSDIELKVYNLAGTEQTTGVTFKSSGVTLTDTLTATYGGGTWTITVNPLEAGTITITATVGTNSASVSYKVHGLMVDVNPTSFSSTTDYNDVNVTVTTLEGLTISIAKVQLEQGTTVIDYLGAVLPGDPVGLYRFNISAVQVGTEWADAIQVVVGIDLGSALGKYTFVGDNFGGDLITVSYDILDVTLDRGNVTALIDESVVITVKESGTPVVGATVYADGCGYINEALSGTTSTLGKLTFSFDGQTGIIPGALTLRAVASDKTKTGSTTLNVLKPSYMLYNLTVNDHTTDVVTAGLDAYIYNATVVDGDGSIILSTDTTIVTNAEVGLYFNASSDQTGLVTGGAGVDSGKLLLAPEGYAITKIPKVSTAKGGYVAYELFEFKVCDKNDGGVPHVDANLLNVYNLTISLPIVSSSTGPGFPITYTAYVGQSQNFYVKIQDADGVPVEGATIEIIAAGSAAASGETDSDGETTITWEPTSTGTYKLRLNGVLNIGTVTVESYTPPQLVIDYTPKPVYLDNLVTISVTADGELSPGIPVSIVDPDGITIERTTTGAGTCTFTANKLGAWDIWAYYSEDDYEYISIDVLEYGQPELPAETTNEETLDSTGAPKTSFASGETVLVSAAVSNVGTESQSMLIVVQLKDPDYRVLAPSYISVTLEPGQSLTPSIGFVLPMTGYTTGTWTAKVMVFDTWPALGGVTIGEPKTITFTVTS